jgi:hypothetical protein
MRNQVTLSLKGADKVFKNLKAYPEKVQKAVDNSMMINMTDINADQVNTVAVDTGRLKGTLHPPIKEQGNWVLTAGTDYAIHLEYGTVKMAAQPFFFPPYFKRYNKIIKDAKNAIERVR